MTNMPLSYGIQKLTAENIDLYAIWKSGDFTVTYNANGGADINGGTVYKESFCFDEIPTVTELDLFTYEGLKFIGWSQNANSKKGELIGGDIIQQKADITLYAIWENIDTGKLEPADIYGVTDTEYTDENGRVVIIVDAEFYYRLPDGTITDKNGNILNIIFGDVNCDGVVNMQDVTALQKIKADLADYKDYGAASRLNSDCNHDGVVNMQDVTTIQKFLAELIINLDP